MAEAYHLWVCAAAVELHRALLYGRREQLRNAQSPLKLKGGAVRSVEDLDVRSCNTFYHFFHEWIMRTAKDYGVYFYQGMEPEEFLEIL